jgi:hypothetical protein
MGRKSINLLNKDIFYDTDDICNIGLDLPMSPVTSIYNNNNTMISPK